MKLLKLLLFLPLLSFMGCENTPEVEPDGVLHYLKFYLVDSDVLDVNANAQELELYVRLISDSDSIVSGWKLSPKFVSIDGFESLKLVPESETSWIELTKASDNEGRDILKIKITENRTDQSRNVCFDVGVYHSASITDHGQLIIRQKAAPDTTTK